MKVLRRIDIDSIAEQLAGVQTKEGVDPCRSRMRALSKGITFVENDYLLAGKILEHPALQNKEMQSRVIGITGLPGAGKSSLTNHLVSALRKRNKTVAVLAVDPSNVETGGALLGDRVRMQDHFRDEGVFIRSMGSRGALGGVARATRGAIRLAAALQFDYILVETVGIGQSESEIVGIADTTMLVLMPQSGDEIQLMKSGILQLADIYIVNKADLSDPSRMMSEIHENTAPANEKEWCPRVLRTSATEKAGIEEIVQAFEEHALFEKDSEEGRKNRFARLRREVLQDMFALLEPRLWNAVRELPEEELSALSNGTRSSLTIASKTLEQEISFMPQRNIE